MCVPVPMLKLVYSWFAKDYLFLYLLPCLYKRSIVPMTCESNLLFILNLSWEATLNCALLRSSETQLVF